MGRSSASMCCAAHTTRFGLVRAKPKLHSVRETHQLDLAPHRARAQDARAQPSELKLRAERTRGDDAAHERQRLCGVCGAFHRLEPSVKRLQQLRAVARAALRLEVGHELVLRPLDRRLPARLDQSNSLAVLALVVRRAAVQTVGATAEAWLAREVDQVRLRRLGLAARPEPLHRRLQNVFAEGRVDPIRPAGALALLQLPLVLHPLTEQGRRCSTHLDREELARDEHRHPLGHDEEAREQVPLLHLRRDLRLVVGCVLVSSRQRSVLEYARARCRSVQVVAGQTDEILRQTLRKTKRRQPWSALRQREWPDSP